MLTSINGVVCMVLIVCICSNTYQGIKKGAFKAVLPIAALLIAMINIGTGKAVLEHTVNNSITIPVTQTIRQFLGVVGDNLQNVTDTTHHTDAVVLDVGSETIQTIMKQLTQASEEQIDFILQNLLVFVITYLISYFLVNIIINYMSKMLFIGTANHIMGGIIGCITSIIQIWILTDIILLLSTVMPPMKQLNDILLTSSFYRLFYGSNITLKLIGL